MVDPSGSWELVAGSWELAARTVAVVSARKPFLLRVDKEVLDAVQRWADDDLRSVNGQTEFLLRKALGESGRLKTAPRRPPAKKL